MGSTKTLRKDWKFMELQYDQGFLQYWILKIMHIASTIPLKKPGITSVINVWKKKKKTIDVISFKRN